MYNYNLNNKCEINNFFNDLSQIEVTDFDMGLESLRFIEIKFIFWFYKFLIDSD